MSRILIIEDEESIAELEKLLYAYQNGIIKEQQ